MDHLHQQRGLFWFLALHEEGELALRLLSIVGREKIIISLQLLAEDVASRASLAKRKKELWRRGLKGEVTSPAGCEDTPRGVQLERSFQDRELQVELRALRSEQCREIDHLELRWEEHAGKTCESSAWFKQLEWLFIDAMNLIRPQYDLEDELGVTAPFAPDSPLPAQRQPSTSATWSGSMFSSGSRVGVPPLNLSSIIKPDGTGNRAKGGLTSASPPWTTGRIEGGKKTPGADRADIVASLRRRQDSLHSLSEKLIFTLATEGAAWLAVRKQSSDRTPPTPPTCRPIVKKEEEPPVLAAPGGPDQLWQKLDELLEMHTPLGFFAGSLLERAAEVCATVDSDTARAGLADDCPTAREQDQEQPEGQHADLELALDAEGGGWCEAARGARQRQLRRAAALSSADNMVDLCAENDRLCRAMIATATELRRMIARGIGHVRPQASINKVVPADAGSCARCRGPTAKEQQLAEEVARLKQCLGNAAAQADELNSRLKLERERFQDERCARNRIDEAVTQTKQDRDRLADLLARTETESAQIIARIKAERDASVAELRTLRQAKDDAETTVVEVEERLRKIELRLDSSVESSPAVQRKKTPERGDSEVSSSEDDDDDSDAASDEDDVPGGARDADCHVSAEKRTHKLEQRMTQLQEDLRKVRIELGKIRGTTGSGNSDKVRGRPAAVSLLPLPLSRSSSIMSQTCDSPVYVGITARETGPDELADVATAATPRDPPVAVSVTAPPPTQSATSATVPPVVTPLQLQRTDSSSSKYMDPALEPEQLDARVRELEGEVESARAAAGWLADEVVACRSERDEMLQKMTRLLRDPVLKMASGQRGTPEVKENELLTMSQKQRTLWMENVSLAERVQALERKLRDVTEALNRCEANRRALEDDVSRMMTDDRSKLRAETDWGRRKTHAVSAERKAREAEISLVRSEVMRSSRAALGACGPLA